VMSYKDIEKVQAKCTAKEVVKKDAQVKGKRDRKRKNPVPEKIKAKRVRRSEVEVVKDGIAAGGIRDYRSVFQL
jgi:hypothetical protein